VIDPIPRRASLQHRAKPAFGGSDTRWKISCRTDGIAQPLGAITQDVGRGNAFIDQAAHVNAGQPVETRGLKQDVEQMDFA
jgi:hypothetical protein